MASLSQAFIKINCVLVSVVLLAVNLHAATASDTKNPLATNGKQKSSKAVKLKSAKSIKKTQAVNVAKNRKVNRAKVSALKPSKIAKTSAKPVVEAKVATASFGKMIGLDKTPDPLDLHSSVALVVDSQTNEVLLSKNSSAILPIASITKLMTSLIVLDAGLDLHELITITEADVDTEKGSSSRLQVGTQLTRAEMLHLALMSSENRAAHALGRYYPGGLPAFVRAMNMRAHQLQMRDTYFVEPTGLSSKNQSSANDLATLVRAAHQNPLIREYSTSLEAVVPVGQKALQFHNTNGLVRGGTWDIALQKTGYIAEAGRCLVMQVSMAGRELVMVLLDSAGKNSRIRDAERIRDWVMQQLIQPKEVRRLRSL